MSWSESTGSPGLTPREHEVLNLVALGFSAKEIAGRIGIAPRTVEGHTDALRLKMRARNKAHMVTQAVRAGALTIESLAADCTTALAEPVYGR